jgi:hypothetical protein
MRWRAGGSQGHRKLGQPVAVVDQLRQPSPAGLVWTVEMTAGGAARGLGALTQPVEQHHMGFLERRRQHKVAEAGNLPPSSMPRR